MLLICILCLFDVCTIAACIFAALAWFPSAGVINVSSDLIEPPLSPQSRLAVEATAIRLWQKIPFDTKQTAISSRKIVLNVRGGAWRRWSTLRLFTDRWHKGGLTGRYSAGAHVNICGCDVLQCNKLLIHLWTRLTPHLSSASPHSKTLRLSCDRQNARMRKRENDHVHGGGGGGEKMEGSEKERKKQRGTLWSDCFYEACLTCSGSSHTHTHTQTDRQNHISCFLFNFLPHDMGTETACVSVCHFPPVVTVWSHTEIHTHTHTHTHKTSLCSQSKCNVLF